MTDADAKDYDRVKTAIFQWYDVNEETYCHRFRAIKPLENETPVKLGHLSEGPGREMAERLWK